MLVEATVDLDEIARIGHPLGEPGHMGSRRQLMWLDQGVFGYARPLKTMHNPRTPNARISAFNVDRASSDLETGGRLAHSLVIPSGITLSHKLR